MTHRIGLPWPCRALLATVPVIGAPACTEIFADYAQRELVLEPVATIDFAIDRGDVEVYAFDRNGINLYYALVGSLRDIGEVDATVVDDALEVVSVCENHERCEVDWYAEIAFGTAVDVVASHGGVKITGVDGPITAEVDGGGFEGVHVRAQTLDVTVDSGDVTIESIAPPTSVRIAVGDGDVALTLPASTYRCELDTSDGDIDTAGIDCDPTATSFVHVDVEVGDIFLIPGPTP